MPVKKQMYSGPGLPPSTTGQIALPIKTDIDLVRDSIRQIIETGIGERLLQPEFGSVLHQLVFEPIDLVLRAKAEMFITNSVAQQEPRAKILSVTFQQLHNEIHLTYVFQMVKLGRTAQGTIVLPRNP